MLNFKILSEAEEGIDAMTASIAGQNSKYIHQQSSKKHGAQARRSKGTEIEQDSFSFKLM